MKSYITYILVLLATFSFGQEEVDKALLKANDFVFEGNNLVDRDFVAAEMEYRKALSKKPSHNYGTYNLANAYYHSENYDEALIRHVEAAKLAITRAEKHRAFHNLGNTLMQKKLCKEAVAAYKDALRNNPNDEETRYNFAIAKECAKQQQKNDDNKDDKDKDKKDNKDDKEDKKEDNKDNKKEEEDKKEDKKDEGDKDKKEGDDKKDKDGKPKDDKNKDKGKPEDKKKPQPQQGKLSPQQIKNLLEAMNNQEKKVQEKMNAKKAKGVQVKTDKDW